MVYKVRKGIFESASSSTHALVIDGKKNEDYLPKTDTLLINFVDTDFDGDSCYSTLKEKVSYLVSHIISWYKYDVETYDDLIEEVRKSYAFQKIEEFVFKKYNKKIIFPKKYEYDLDSIVCINHQLQCNNFNDLLEDIVGDNINLLDLVLKDGSTIELGHD